MTLTIPQLNALSHDEAVQELLTCCGSRAWARQMTAERPYRDVDSLLATADRVWWALAPDDWLEAFARHPRIGERGPKVAAAAERRWSEGEQSRAHEGAPEVLSDLAMVNVEYENRFGHVFIICATGKGADEILQQARERLHNDPESELRIAAEEQRRITHLRLRKLLTP